jgi:hypothetical protein
MIFGIVGWIMKRQGWPRPPMVLGIVIGGTFERYLYISNSLMGWAWLGRPVVMAILLLVAWALYRPLSEIVKSVASELRHIGSHPLRLSASAAFTIAVIAFILTAIALSSEWPAVAKPVPLTACYMALTFASLNLINELFGKEQTARGNVDGGVAVGGGHEPFGDRYYGMSPGAMRTRATIYFLWLVGLMVLVALIGFIPAIAVFVFAYMHFGFGERALPSAVFAAATTLLCWGLFQKLLAVAWPQSLLGDYFPALRASLGFI